MVSQHSVKALIHLSSWHGQLVQSLLNGQLKLKGLLCFELLHTINNPYRVNIIITVIIVEHYLPILLSKISVKDSEFVAIKNDNRIQHYIDFHSYKQLMYQIHMAKLCQYQWLHCYGTITRTIIIKSVGFQSHNAAAFQQRNRYDQLETQTQIR